MTRDEIRWGANKALERLEWLDTHVTVRTPKHMKQLLRELREIQAYLVKIARME